jgi:parallel beta-helix repeat protein
LDLQGHSLTGPEGTAALGAIGISVETAHGVHVTNGFISRFGIGIQAVRSHNVRIDWLSIRGQDLGGTPPSVEVGIHVLDSRGVVVMRNLITSTFLGIFVRGEGSSGNTLRDNTVTGGANAALGICYNPGLDGTGGPQGDLVYNNHLARFRVGIQITSRARDNLFLENFIHYLDRSVEDMSSGANLVEDNKATAASP